MGGPPQILGQSPQRVTSKLPKSDAKRAMNGGGISGILPPSIPQGINTANYINAIAMAQ